jgi:hypothetical protein
VAGLVGRCNGARPLRGLVTETAEGLAADRNAVAKALMPIVRGLLERGFLRLRPSTHPV